MTFTNKGSKTPHTFAVSIPAAKPAVTKLDFIVYLLPWDFRTIAGSGTTDNVLAQHWGFTSGGSATVEKKSEIIVKSNDGSIIGSLVLHEMLHYKTGKGNAELHQTGGLGAASVSGTSVLNDANRTDIKSTVTREIAPWLGGWDICASAKFSKEHGDPFWNH